MEEALRALILSDTGTTTLVSQRVTWWERPQGSSLPAIVLSIIDTIPNYHMQGPSDLVASRVQADIYADRYATAKGVARALTAFLSGYRGIQDGIDFQAAFVDGERDFDGQGANQSEKISRVSVDFIIWHS